MTETRETYDTAAQTPDPYEGLWLTDEEIAAIWISDTLKGELCRDVADAATAKAVGGIVPMLKHYVEEHDEFCIYYSAVEALIDAYERRKEGGAMLTTDHRARIVELMATGRFPHLVEEMKVRAKWGDSVLFYTLGTITGAIVGLTCDLNAFGRAVMWTPLLHGENIYGGRVVLYIYGPDPLMTEPEIVIPPMPDDLASRLNALLAVAESVVKEA